MSELESALTAAAYRVRSGHLIRAEGEEFNKNSEQHSNTFTMTPPGANRDLEYRSEQHKENVAHE